MATTFVNSSSQVAASGVALTMNLPAGMQQGDVVAAAIGKRFNGGLTITSVGWTPLVDESQSTFVNLQVYLKVMGAVPDTTIAFSNTTPEKAGVALAWRGVDTSTPQDAAATFATGATGAPNPPSITTVTDLARVVVFGVNAQGDIAVTEPTGYTNALAAGTGNASTMGAAREVSPAGAENPAAWTNVTSGSWVAVSIALRAAVPPSLIIPSASFLPFLVR